MLVGGSQLKVIVLLFGMFARNLLLCAMCLFCLHSIFCSTYEVVSWEDGIFIYDWVKEKQVFAATEISSVCRQHFIIINLLKYVGVSIPSLRFTNIWILNEKSFASSRTSSWVPQTHTPYGLSLLWESSSTLSCCVMSYATLFWLDGSSVLLLYSSATGMLYLWLAIYNAEFSDSTVLCPCWQDFHRGCIWKDSWACFIFWRWI